MTLSLQQRRRMKKLVLPLICAMLCLALSTSSNAENSAKDEEMIRSIVTEMTEGFNNNDTKAASQMYTADADFVTVRGERAKGASEIERLLADIFATRAKEATQRTLNVTIRFIAPDIAVAHVTNELSGVVRPDGQKLPPHTELSLRVFVKGSRRGCGWNRGRRSLRLVHRAMTGGGTPAETTPWMRIAPSGRPRRPCSPGRPGSTRSRRACGSGSAASSRSCSSRS